MTERIIFADCEGDDFLDNIQRMWCLQLAEGVDGEVVVYADHPGYPSMEDGLKLLREADRVVFHNAFGFDFFAINKLFPGTLRREQIIDTLIISRLMNTTSMRHNLAELGEALGFPKGDHDDFSQFSEAMAKYGRRDVQILQEAWKGNSARNVRSFGKFYEKYHRACELEFHVAYILEKQRQHGFRFDYDRALMLETELRHEQKQIERELQEIFPPIVTPRYSEKQIDKKTGKPKRLKDKVEVFNPGSRDQIAQRLIDKYGWKPIDLTPTKKPRVDEGILEDLPYPEAHKIAQYMRLGKKLGQLADGDNAWLKLADQKPGDFYYLHGQVNSLGARTHRMSHFKPNMAQVDKDPRMRGLFLADPDWDLVGFDADGLELRELAHFLYPYDQGRYVEIVHSGKKEDGTDIHSVNRKANGLFLRDSAKTMIYAHNYGCFDKKLGIIVVEDLKKVIDALSAEDPTDAQKKVAKEVKDRITLEEAQERLESLPALSRAGAELRSKIEVGIVGLGELIAKCKRQHERKGQLPGHDGRLIPSASDHSALNTLLQGNGSVVMKQALVCFEEELDRLQLLDKVGYCANVHDEVQLTCHPDITEKVAELGAWSIQRAGEVLEVRCPLVGSADIGKTWADTH